MVITGLEKLLNDPGAYRKRRVALIANQTSVTSDLVYSWHALIRRGIDIVRIFSPEHGIFATEQDQAPVGDQPIVNCEVVSLYGASAHTLAPAPEFLDDIDCVIYDIQDIGSRYYTYVNTMALCMEAIAGRDIEFVVLDRPNPIGGQSVEGPPLRDGYGSFVGVLPVPVRHGMTAGELALLWKAHRRLDVNLAIVPMDGWGRAMGYAHTGLPWVPPSPNMPTEETALVYPGMCLIEGTNLSEGRGTAMPFLQIGAPYVDAAALANRLNALNLPGIRFRAVYCKPTSNKYAGEVAGGVFLHVTDPTIFRPFAAGVALVQAARELYPDAFRLTRGVYEFNDTHPAFDLLAGSDAVRTMIERGVPLDTIRESWADYERDFFERRKEYLLYAS